ncbi:MAG: MBL fold metallo-hydrolase [Ktedonobacterales bacterium]
MSIDFNILGDPDRDNALFVRVQTGQALHRLLFDCGEGCLSALPVAEVQAVDHLCFSHLHMDHIGGFDSFFRVTYNRESKPVRAWGPPETARILHHRFQGFLWNLYEGQPGTWYVSDLHLDHSERWRFEASEAFAQAHEAGTRPFDGTLLDDPAFTISALHMDHLTPSLAYILREKPRVNVDTARMAALGLHPGPWLQRVKAPQLADPPTIEIDGTRHAIADLRARLLVETPGDSIAYLTDFLLDEAAMERLSVALHGCTTLVCESQYHSADADLAREYHHMTAAQAAQLAQRAHVGRLILIHVSARYRPAEWLALLDEARAVFPNTTFPAHWRLTSGA